jgi:molybdenum-dependent DNA-binding transcriptional regulator ModE
LLLFGAFLLFCAVPLAAAADTDALAKDPITGLTADRAVKLGFEKFQELYGRQADAVSTAGMCEVSSTYARLRRYVNDRAAGKRTKQQRVRIGQARDLCLEITGAYTSIREAASGGGTMYRIFWAYGAVDAENTVGKLILSMEQPKANARGRAEAHRMIQSLIAGIEKLPAAFTEYPEDAPRWKEQRGKAIKQLRVALPALQQLCKSVPDNGAFYLARFAGGARKNVEE